MLLAESESHGLHNDHKGKDEELVDKRRGVILRPEQVIRLEKKKEELDGNKKAEVEDIDVQEEGKRQVIIHYCLLTYLER